MSTATTVSEKPSIVTIRRSGQVLQIEPPCPELLLALRTMVREIKPTSPRGYNVVAVARLLYDVLTTMGRLVFQCGSGLEPVVRRVLEEAGIGTRIVEPEDPYRPLPPPELTLLKNMKPIDMPLLECVRQHERALICIEPAAVKPARLIAEIALAWPDKTIAVAVTRRHDAWQLASELRKHVAASVITGQKDPAEVERVVVTTYRSLAHGAAYRSQPGCGLDVGWLDIVITLDAVEAVAKVPASCLVRARRGRLYGLMDRNATPAPLEKDVMAALFGFNHVVVPAHGQRERPVKVVTYPVHCGMQAQPINDVVAVKRHCLWHHPIRNRTVTTLARLLKTGDHAQLQERFPAVAAVIGDNTPKNIVVVVECIEHALALLRRLPGWSLITGMDAHTSDLSAAKVKIFQAATKNWQAMPTGAVVTVAGLESVAVSSPDVVIRADGGMGLPPLPDRLLTQPAEEPPRPLLLIDLHDRYHPWLRQCSRKRRLAYAERGWFAPGVDAVQAQIDHFLARRPTEVKS